MKNQLNEIEHDPNPNWKPYLNLMEIYWPKSTKTNGLNSNPNFVLMYDYESNGTIVRIQNQLRFSFERRRFRSIKIKIQMILIFIAEKWKIIIIKESGKEDETKNIGLEKEIKRRRRWLSYDYGPRERRRRQEAYIDVVNVVNGLSRQVSI